MLIVLAFPVQSQEIIRGRVVGVQDGDTLTMLTDSYQQLKIRLAQIDAPESDQDFGQASKQSLASMVFNRTVKVWTETVDANGRIVGTVFVDGKDVNREQVKQGMAWAYRQYLHDLSLLAVEGQARSAKTGLWSLRNPMPPWAYRHGGREYTEKNPSRESMPLAQQNQSSTVSCGSKHTCKEMASCEEANYFLNQCGLSQLDKDKDG
ncbi:MAG: thermonuclease family protein, partial [Candidatus Methylumidiphilus sp.]